MSGLGRVDWEEYRVSELGRVDWEEYRVSGLGRVDCLTMNILLIPAQNEAMGVVTQGDPSQCTSQLTCLPLAAHGLRVPLECTRPVLPLRRGRARRPLPPDASSLVPST